MKKPIIGISACLLGQEVRFDGGHKRDRFITDILGRYVEFYPLCPEMESGMGAPRDSLRLTDVTGEVRLITNKTGEDKTQQLQQWCDTRTREIEEIPFCGFIFKSKSPSCGLHRVKVYGKHMAEKKGQGLFAKSFQEHFPLIPLEEEGRLHDDALRENFIERLFIMQRWYTLIESQPTLHDLLTFHTKHKYLLMSHSPNKSKELGAFLAAGKKDEIQSLLTGYQEKLFPIMSQIATAKKQTNTLHHIMGYFKKDLTKDEKAELVEVIDRYHDKLVPLIVPITLLNHYVRKYQPEYLRDQYYLNPHPMELMLRNHV